VFDQCLTSVWPLLYPYLTRWDLTNMSDYFCAVSGGACAGPNAPCTPAAGDVCALRQQAQKTVAPFKLCVRGVQLVPAGVDLARFEAVYGYPLANDTCASCFVISVLSPPFFISQGAVAAGTPNDRSEFYLAVGEPLSNNLLGGSINIGMPVTTARRPPPAHNAPAPRPPPHPPHKPRPLRRRNSPRGAGHTVESGGERAGKGEAGAAGRDVVCHVYVCARVRVERAERDRLAAPGALVP
jgi:hypothetical protein